MTTTKDTGVATNGNTGTAQTQQMITKQFFSQGNVKKRFEELLGQKANSFISSVLQAVNSNKNLADADTNSIFQASMMAAVLDLPINSNLGFAYIIPYGEKIGQIDKFGKEIYKQVAQFQMGYKGFQQLALRSGQFKHINVTDVREGEIKHRDRLSGEITFEWIQDEEERLAKPIIGYVSFFSLLNGFEKLFYMSMAQVKKHGKTYSKSFDNKYGRWNLDFDSMAFKTVLKLNLSKNAPLSVDMQKAIIMDQAVIKDAETEDISYVDHTDDTPETNKLEERIVLMIGDATSKADLKAIEKDIPENLLDLFNQKMTDLK